MRRFVTLLSVFSAFLFVTSTAWAQASGSFSYNDQGAAEHCILNSSNGNITGGYTCSESSTCTEYQQPTCTADPGCTCDTNTNTCVTCTSSGPSGTCGGTFVAGIKGNGGNGNVFVVEPSAVIGLLTDVTLQKNSSLDVGTSSAMAGVDFSVTATDGNGTAVAPTPNFPVTYDSRFIQISSNLFDVLSTQCATTTGCFFTFNESTVSAHSFQWLLPEDGTSGTYTITAMWASSLGNAGISNSLTCVGPVNVTIQQNKVYHFNSVNVSNTTN